MDPGIDPGADAGLGDRGGRRNGAACIIGAFFFTEYAANCDRECRTVRTTECRTDRIADSGTDCVADRIAECVPNSSTYSIADHAANGGSCHTGTD